MAYRKMENGRPLWRGITTVRLEFKPTQIIMVQISKGLGWFSEKHSDETNNTQFFTFAKLGEVKYSELTFIDVSWKCRYPGYIISYRKFGV